jgi:Cof subfamily protein (haloacid dehalogenase superfamily)
MLNGDTQWRCSHEGMRMTKKDRRPVSLVVCDLDGTLLGPGGTGIDKAKKVADFSRSHSIGITVATGRVYGAVVEYVKCLGISLPVITNGGARVAAVGAEPIYEKIIDAELARAVSRELRSLNLPFYYLSGKDILTEWEGPETIAYSESISFDIRVVPSLEPLGVSPTQIAVRAQASEAPRLLELFRRRWSAKLTVIRSLPHLIEFQAPGVSKASALEFLAGSYGIGPDRVLAVGDGLNDLDMLSWAGRSACVGNGCQEAKAVASYVASGTYAEGVMEAVKNFIGT